MDTFIGYVIGAAWLAILVMLVWGVIGGWRRVLRDDTPLPFFRWLEREGLSAAQMEDAVGMGQLARATERCTLCALRPTCHAGLLGGWMGERPADCPNAGLFDRAHSLKPIAL